VQTEFVIVNTCEAADAVVWPVNVATPTLALIVKATPITEPVAGTTSTIPAAANDIPPVPD